MVLTTGLLPADLSGRERLKRLCDEPTSGECLSPEQVALGVIDRGQHVAVDRVESRETGRDVTAGELDPRELELEAQRAGPRAGRSEQVASTDQVRLGRADLTPLGQQNAAVAQQLRLPETIVGLTQRPQSSVGPGEHRDIRARVDMDDDPEHLRPRLFMAVKPCGRRPEFAQRPGEESAPCQVQREPAACKRGPTHESVPLTDPDRVLHVADGQRVALLVSCVAERVQRCDLRLNVAFAASPVEYPFAEPRRRGGVDLDHRKGLLGEPEQILPAIPGHHSSRCIKGTLARLLNVHRIPIISGSRKDRH